MSVSTDFTADVSIRHVWVTNKYQAENEIEEELESIEKSKQFLLQVCSCTPKDFFTDPEVNIMYEINNLVNDTFNELRDSFVKVHLLRLYIDEEEKKERAPEE